MLQFILLNFCRKSSEIKDIWLLGPTKPSFANNYLTSNKDVLRVYFFHHNITKSVSASLDKTVQQVMNTWFELGFTTQSKNNVKKSLREKLLMPYKSLLKRKDQRYVSKENSRHRFKINLKNVFNILSAVKSDNNLTAKQEKLLKAASIDVEKR